MRKRARLQNSQLGRGDRVEDDFTDHGVGQGGYNEDHDFRYRMPI